jgi:hypothetical protein
LQLNNFLTFSNRPSHARIPSASFPASRKCFFTNAVNSRPSKNPQNEIREANPILQTRTGQYGFGVQSGAIAFAWVTLMSPVQANVWVPVCCDRVMRYNMFVPKGGSAYGALVCTVCSKNITFELEPLLDLNTYGEGARVLNMLGSPKPPKANRPKAAAEERLKDQTL